MYRWLTAGLSALCISGFAAGLVTAPPAEAQPPQPVPPQPVPAPPYIDHTQWVTYGGHKSSLRVYPTRAGRLASGPISKQGDEAWSEVLADAPDAATPGMRAQFLCHWYFAEAASPGKTSWNLEPWRPVVDDQTMVRTRCNPGDAEEPF
ncbi:DUF2599 domain-containing protein [Mycobacterium sp. OTB74]|uniref:DUF2599 domain-containing protein n=1 Tax=Mycobacterium sp. OTB74 TaxID=1853452 RepID=UPI002476A719|nr:DUF2599 domain-containing protein [Mycobacterium sp. OTB74]MDH6246345.1 hypothetical protein [Mycobacterium sp. OTB74]